MTAKEHAHEIIREFSKEIPLHPNDTQIVAIRCAIIHVKGFIEVLDIFPRHQMTPSEIERLDYWQQVLTELNQM